jgi:hypothetical protein
VRVRSPYGATVLPARISTASPPGQLFATFHTPRAFVNRVTGPARDAVTHTPAYKLTAVALEKTAAAAPGWQGAPRESREMPGAPSPATVKKAAAHPKEVLMNPLRPPVPGEPLPQRQVRERLHTVPSDAVKNAAHLSDPTHRFHAPQRGDARSLVSRSGAIQRIRGRRPNA